MRMHTIDIEQLVMRHKPLKNPHPTINSVGYTAFTVKEKPLLFQTRNQELGRCKRIPIYKIVVYNNMIINFWRIKVAVILFYKYLSMYISNDY